MTRRSSIYNGCDALSKKTIEVIKQTGSNYVLQVKWNQWYLEHECKLVPQRKEVKDIDQEEWRTGRWRRERRTVRVYERKDCDTPEADKWWELLKVVIVVKREARVTDTKNKVCYQRNEESH